MRFVQVARAGWWASDRLIRGPPVGCGFAYRFCENKTNNSQRRGEDPKQSGIVLYCIDGKLTPRATTASLVLFN